MDRLKDAMDYLTNEMEGTADWRRRVAEEYPDDDRNKDAVADLTRLAQTVADVSEEGAAQYNALWKGDGGANDERASMTQSEMLRAVGFSESWDTAEEFIEELARRVAR